NVSSESGFDLVSFHIAVDSVGAAHHLHHLLLLNGGENFCAAKVDEGLHAEPDSFLGDKLRARLIHQVPVFDNLYPGRDRALNRTGSVSMRRDVSAPISSRFYRGTHLGFRKGGDLQRTDRG